VDIIKVVVKEMGCDGVVWIHVPVASSSLLGNKPYGSIKG
jgi:hypothetical protein